MKQDNAFTAAFMVGLLSAFSLALAIELLGNSTGLFPSLIYPPSGERAWKTRRIDEAVRSRRMPQVVILGSSLMMQFQPSYVQAITGKTTFNYGVSNATSTDYLTQLRYLLKSGCKPELIIAGVTPRTFSKYWTFDRLSTVELFGHGGLFLEVPFPENACVLGSVIRRCDTGTMMNSLSRLLKPKPRPSKSIGDANFLFLEDGYLIYCIFMRQKMNGTFDLEGTIEQAVQGWTNYPEGTRPALFGEPDQEKQRHFEEFLSLAHSKGIEVRIVSLPIQPDFERRACYDESQQAHARLSEYIRAVSGRLGASFTDFSDSRSYAGDPKEFYDIAHQTPANTQRMINVLFGLPANRVIAHVPTDLEIMANPPAVTSLSTE